jgi:antitoxin HicB
MVTGLKRKPMEFYFELRYPVTIMPSEDGGYVAEIEDLPGCVTQGETLEEVHANIEEARRLWIEVAYEDGQDIPQPRDKQLYSGNFIVRGPKSLHRKLDQMAKREGVSLNQYLVATLSHSVGMDENTQSKKKKREMPRN